MQRYHLHGILAALCWALSTNGEMSIASSAHCSTKTPICTDPSYNYLPDTPSPTLPDLITTGLQSDCIKASNGWGSWHYFRSATPGNLQVTIEAYGLRGTGSAIQWAVWGPFNSPEPCGTALGTPLSRNCTSTTINIATAGGKYYVFAIQLLGVKDPPHFSLLPVVGALDCVLMNVWPVELAYGQHPKSLIALRGTALIPVESGWVVGLQGTGGGCQGNFTTEEIVSYSSVTIDLADFSGLVLVCLKQVTGAYSPAWSFIIRIFDWAVSPTSVSAGSPVSFAVQGLAAFMSPFAAIIGAHDDCTTGAAAVALKVNMAIGQLVVPQTPTQAGAYQICFWPQAQWARSLSVPLTVMNQFYIAHPITHVTGQGAVTLQLAGSALVPGSSVLLMSATDSCNTATMEDAWLPLDDETGGADDAYGDDDFEDITVDFSSYAPGMYQICLLLPTMAQSTLSDVLTVLSFAASHYMLQAAPSQSISFKGAILDDASSELALLPASLSCPTANQLANEIMTVSPQPGIDLVLDLSMVLPGYYHWCWRSTGLFQEGFELPLEVSPPNVTVLPNVVLRSAKVDFRLSHWVGESLVATAQLVPTETNCSTLLPAHLEPGPTAYLIKTAALAFTLDLTDVPAGQYKFCLRTSLGMVAVPSEAIQVLDLQVSETDVSRQGQQLLLKGNGIAWGDQSSAALVPWSGHCSTDAAVSLITAPIVSQSGLATCVLDLTQALGQDVRLCIRGSQWPYQSFQDGLELALRVVGTFALGKAIYLRNAGTELQVEGSALTGNSDFLVITDKSDCLSSDFIMRSHLGSPLDFSTLSPGSYSACLQPRGTPSAILRYPFIVVNLSLAQSAFYTATTSLGLTGSILDQNGAAVAVVPIGYLCSTVPTSAIQALSNVDFSDYLPGSYQLCIRPGKTPYVEFMDGLACPLQLMPALQVAPASVFRSAAAQLTFMGPLVPTTDETPGAAAVLGIQESCENDAHHSPMQAASFSASTPWAIDISLMNPNVYKVCYQPPGGKYSDALTAYITVLPLGLALNSTIVPSLPNVTLWFVGCIPNAATTVKLIPWMYSCSEAAERSTAYGRLQQCTLTLNLSLVGYGWQRLCYQSADESFQVGMELLLEIIQVPSLRYFPHTIPGGAAQVVTIQGQGLDLRPFADILRIVTSPDGCQLASQLFMEVSDLGPDDANSASFASAWLTFNGTGTYWICYRPNGLQWELLDPPLVVVPGVSRFNGIWPPYLAAGKLNRVIFTVLSSTNITANLSGSSAIPQISAVRASLAAQSSDGGCAVQPKVFGPSSLDSGQLTLMFGSAGAYVMCQQARDAGAYPIALFQVVNQNCGPELVPDFGCVPCPVCDTLWIWLWPLILAFVLGFLALVCMWLLVRRNSQPYRQMRRRVAQAAFHPSVEASDPESPKDVFAERMVVLDHDLRTYQRELRVLRTTSGPIEIRRIEVPVERIVHVPVIETQPREVVVEKVVEVEVPQVVPRHVIREVEKEVVHNRLVPDVDAERALIWARQDIELLKSEIAVRTRELQDARKLLEDTMASPLAITF